MANNINVGAVISPSVLKTISSSTAIKTFGDQLVNKAKEKVISVALGKVQILKDQIQEIVTLKIKVWSDHGTEMKRLEVLLKEKQITEEQYNLAVAKEEEAYQKKLRDLEELELKLKEDLANIIADPIRKIKEIKNRRKVKREARKNRNKAERAKARRDLAKKVIKNAAKTLAPIIALQLANQFASVLSQRAKLEELVDQVNVYIEQANTPETIAVATNLRGSGNVILGYKAAGDSIFLNTSNKLIIANDKTKTPLIYGEFDNKKVTINGDLTVTGKLNGASGTGNTFFMDTIQNIKINIHFDKTKPDGTPRKLLDTTIAKKYGWRPKISLKDGFFLTYADYLKKY